MERKDVIIVQRPKSSGAPAGRLSIFFRKSSPDIKDWISMTGRESEWNHIGDFLEGRFTVSFAQAPKFMAFALASGFDKTSVIDMDSHTEFIFERDATQVDFEIESRNGLKVSYKS